MADKHLLFSAPMVRALLDGRKTVTRRLLKPQPSTFTPNVVDIKAPILDENEGGWGQWETEWSSPSHDLPYGQPEREVWRPLRVRYAPGDRIWVRETCRAEELTTGLDGVRYPADGAFIPIENTRRAGERWGDLYHYGGKRGGRLVPSIHMPRWASRLTLDVEAVRVEKLQAISTDDCLAEGIDANIAGLVIVGGGPPLTAKAAFRALWEDINGPESWDENPWVVAITFAVRFGNIDAADKGAK